MSDLTSTLESLRVSYQMASLDLKDCDPDPLTQFDKWFDESLKCQLDEPNAFTLSTVDGQKPRARVVLLKGVVEGKFVFYTNYQSDKGHELEKNPHASMTFLWLPLQRQVRIEGTIKKVPVEMSEDYFHKRPRGSQLGAIASPQSHKMKSRQDLEALFEQAEAEFKDTQDLPRPPHWGGYMLEPQYLEFWQGRNNRLHDRMIYERSGSSWTLGRLAP